MQTADVRYRFLGDSSDLEAAGKSAQAALDATAREATVAGKKVGDSFEHIGEKAGKLGSAAKKLRGGLGAISPELANLAGAVDDAADAVEVFAASSSSVVGVLGPVALALGALAAAYLVVTEGIARENAVREDEHRLAGLLIGVNRQLEDTQLDLAVAYGALTDAQRDQITTAIEAQRAVLDFAASQGEQRKALQDTIDSAGTIRGVLNAAGLGWAGFAVDAVKGTSDAQAALARLDATQATFIERTKENRIGQQALNEITDQGTAKNDARNASLAKTISLQEQIQAELDALAIAAENNDKRAQKIAAARDERLQAELDALDNQRALEEQHAAFREEQAAAEIRMREEVASAITGTLAEVGEKTKEAGKAGFAVWKATALADIAVSTIVAASRALADLGPIAGAVAAVGIGVSGALAAGQVAAEQPTFHMGGTANRVDEVNATLQRGESVLTARGTAEIVSAINRGQMGGGGSGVQLQVYEHRVFGRFIRDEVKAPTVLGNAITSARSVMPGRRPRRT